MQFASLEERCHPREISDSFVLPDPGISKVNSHNPVRMHLRDTGPGNAPECIVRNTPRDGVSEDVTSYNAPLYGARVNPQRVTTGSGDV